MPAFAYQQLPKTPLASRSNPSLLNEGRQAAIRAIAANPKELLWSNHGTDERSQ